MPEKTPDPDAYGRYRVLDLDTGHKRSVVASQLPHGNHQVLDEDASDVAGDALPIEYGAVAPAEVDPYEGWTVPKLKDQVDARNDARGEGEALIKVETPGHKAELLAALRADDERNSS